MSEAKRAKKAHEFTHVLAIDVEATGPNIVRNWMPEFGASFWRIGDKAPLQTFYRCVAQPPETEWDEETRTSFWLKPFHPAIPSETLLAALEERIAENTVVSPEKAMREFVEWARMLERSCAADERIVVITDTAEFDTSFVNQYLGRFVGSLCPNLNRLFGEYRATRDIDSFYFGVGRTLKQWGAEGTALGTNDELPHWVLNYRGNHNPLEDANLIGASASYILARCLKNE